MFESILGGTDTSDLTQRARSANKNLNKGMRHGLAALDTAQSQYTPTITNASDAFNPFLSNGSSLSDLYTGALGGSGQAGYDAAAGAFHNTFGFQAGLDAANQNILRNQAQTGGLNSGNTLLSLGNEAQNRQNQEYNTWLDNLFRGSGQGLQAAGGKGGLAATLASLQSGTGNSKADVLTGGFGAKATNLSNLGAQLQGQTAADQASQLALLNAIIGGGSKIAGAYAGGPTGAS